MFSLVDRRHNVVVEHPDQAHLLAAAVGAGDTPTFLATVLAALAVAVAPCSMPRAAAFAPR